MPETAAEPPRKKIVLDLDWQPEPEPGPHTVTFLPHGRRVSVEHGLSVFEAGKRIGEFIPTDCGGKGTCGRCRVRVESEARPPTYVEKAFIPREELAHNVRLSCRLRVEADVAVTVLSSPARNTPHPSPLVGTPPSPSRGEGEQVSSPAFKRQGSEQVSSPAFKRREG